jgi:hypothetical protein
MRTRLGLIAVMAMLTWACLGPMKIQQPLSPTFGDLATVKDIEVVGENGTVLAKGTLAEARGAGTTGKVERSATLTNPSGGGPMGTVEIDIDRTGSLSEEEVQIKLENLPYPASFRVMADGKELTTFSTIGKGRMNVEMSRRVTLSNGK